MTKTVPVLRLAAVALALAALSQGASAGFFSSSNEESSSQVLAEATRYASTQEAWARPFAYALYRDGEWGAVLNFQRLGVAAMQINRPDVARKAFDQAIQRVEAIYADDPNAARARSVFNAEKVKDFKGEPYERAMLYYYRGLLYLHDGDYQNARASFLAADRHVSLSSAESTAFKSDFGLMKYLAGWASACDDDGPRSAALVSEARGADPLIARLQEALPSALVLVDSGPAPVKWGGGTQHEVLKFRAGTGDDPDLALVLGGERSSQWSVVGDLAHQATTRGGREIDGIMAGKAKFKDNTDAVGTVASDIGTRAALMGAINNDRGMANLGMAGMLIGLIAKGVAASAVAAADTRAWDTLPGRILMHGAPTLGEAPVQFAIDGRTVPASLQATHGRCAFAWVRTRSALDASMGGTAAMPDNSPMETDRGDRNRAMRAMLASDMTVAAQ
jgi:tetratricopeptide (TPR) repeat protein